MRVVRDAERGVSAIGRQFVSANAGLVLSSAVTLSATVVSDGYPNDTKTPRITDGGNSGGPLFLDGTHTLVGTETRFDPARGLDYWARLDGAVYTFVQNAIAAHGGTDHDPVVDFVQEVGSVLCGRAASCCKVGNASYVLDPTTCRDTYARYGFESTARDMLAANHAKLSIDAAKRSSWLSAVGDTTKCTMTSAAVKANSANCIAAVVGSVGAGGACTHSVECTNGVCSGGTCQAVVGQNGSCEIADKSGTVDECYDLAQDLCSKRGGGTPAMYCDGYDFVAGAYKTEATWSCQPAKIDGQSCGTSPECTSSICVPFGDANQFTCQSTAPFATTAACAAFQ